MQKTNRISLHTLDGCDHPPANTSPSIETGNLISTDCFNQTNFNQGCIVEVEGNSVRRFLIHSGQRVFLADRSFCNQSVRPSVRSERRRRIRHAVGYNRHLRLVLPASIYSCRPSNRHAESRWLGPPDGLLSPDSLRLQQVLHPADGDHRYNDLWQLCRPAKRLLPDVLRNLH